MRLSKLVLGTVAAAGLVVASSASAVQVMASGDCKLTNVAADKVLYDGGCTIQQATTDYGSVYTITMGSAKSFKFAGSGTEYMHGPKKVHFKDLGPQGGIFTWDDFALSAVAHF